MTKKFLLSTLGVFLVGFLVLSAVPHHALFAQTEVMQKEMSPAEKPPVELPAGPSPRIVIDDEDKVFDLGTLAQMAEKEVIIKFRNTGEAPLKIEKVKPG